MSFTDDTIQIRNFPKQLAIKARTMFPLAKSNTEAVTALCAVHCGNAIPSLSDSVKLLISNYEADLTVADLSNQLNVLHKNLVSIDKKSDEAELLLVYLLCDRLALPGLRDRAPATPNDIILLEDTVRAALSTIRDQARVFRNSEKISDGRPIK